MGPHSLVLSNQVSVLNYAATKQTATRIKSIPPPEAINISTILPAFDVPASILPLRRHFAGGSKEKVVFVLGATGTGKSRLAVDLALATGAEIVNSDKMQVYQGLDVVTNKVTEEECAGVPHHLLGFLHPDADFTAADFRRRATDSIDDITSRGKLPIVAGGSNNYIEALVDGRFRSRYDCCFLWVDVGLRMLNQFVAERVDRMLRSGLVDEVRHLFDPLAEMDYTRGVRRAIGVPEMDAYLRAEWEGSPAARWLLEAAIAEIKANTYALVRRQLGKIQRLSTLPGWQIHRLDATEAFRTKKEDVWRRKVAAPASEVLSHFLLCPEPYDSAQMMTTKKKRAAVAVVAAGSTGRF